MARWQRVIGDSIDYAPYQEAAVRYPHIPRENFARAIHLIESGGRVSTGAEAMLRALAHAPKRGWPLWLYENVPLLAPVAEFCYRLVARNRPLADRVTTWLWGRHVIPPGETRTVALFLRLLGVIYVAAFFSLWVQVAGLLGSNGILPAHEYLAAARSQLSIARLWFLPTLLWLNSSDLALHVLCAVGALSALLAVAGLVPVATLAAAWLSYLSLSTVGQDFLRFQWDGLLLETGFVAILLAPWHFRSRLTGDPPPSRAALWLARWLLFRLMLASAAVKITSGDPTWHNLTALDYHYFTQPLPPWTAWYASHFAAGVQKLSVVVMFACEGIAPFLLFGPRRVRFTGAAVIAALQVLILLTGNYGFFNLLTLVLCVPALDDGLLTRGSQTATASTSVLGVRRWPRRAVVAGLFALSFVPLSYALRIGQRELGPLEGIYRLASPLQLVNPYGLFAVMTTERREIIVEGSMDGQEWKTYEFKYKPGDLTRRPAFTTPHMPRVDWQMWFAALGDWRQNQWFLAFCKRLLEGSSSVGALLSNNPFVVAPPRYVRARLYQYRFSTATQRKLNGDWWERTPAGTYLPTLMLRDGRLTLVADTVAP